MAAIGLFFGSSTGHTEDVAYEMKAEFDKLNPELVDIYNIGATSVEQFMSDEYLICGIPTWNQANYKPIGSFSCLKSWMPT